MSSRLLWDVLAGAYERLGFDGVGDETFKALVLARIVEPTSKADTIRVLEEIGVGAPGLRTIFRSLGRCIGRDYREQVAKACVARSAAEGPVAMVSAVRSGVTVSRQRSVAGRAATVEGRSVHGEPA